MTSTMSTWRSNQLSYNPLTGINYTHRSEKCKHFFSIPSNSHGKGMFFLRMDGKAHLFETAIQANGGCPQAKPIPGTQPDHAKGEKHILPKAKERFEKKAAQSASEEAVLSVPAKKNDGDQQQRRAQHLQAWQQGP